ncbi:MAG: AMP-binding protein [Mycobacterium sp.]|uniref:AMP-binding protein n=1 Tax=Mycobacterium sp. TaxID=1785 RepID=UPI003CC66114
MSNDERNGLSTRFSRWNSERIADAYARGWWVQSTLADSLRDAAQQTPRRPVLVDGDVRLDCRQLHDQATALAAAISIRMPVGSVVSFMLPNWHEAAVVYLAATLAGMVVNPVLPSLRDGELLFILEDAGSRIIFVPAHYGRYDYASMMDRVTAQLDRPVEVVVLRGDEADDRKTPFASLLTPPTGAALPVLNPDAVRMVLYTSGTTGRPKGVLHSHNSMHALMCQLREHWSVEPGDRFLVPSPIAHIGGSIYAFEGPLLLSTTAVLMDRWNADDAVRLMQAEHCTHIAGATPFLEQILAAARRAGTRLPDLKLFVCGGASVSPSLIRSAADYFDRAAVTRVYGSTEVPITTIGSPAEAGHAADTDGRAGSAQIRLVSDDVAALDGEVRARGPQMLVGYLHPEDEVESFDPEGYFRTGDLGRWVDGAYLLITGRAKDIIIRNGENISPKEIEDLLADHPDIAEVAIVGVPDERTGERACAAIVPKASRRPDVAALREYLQARGVAKFKMPEQVVIRNGLPKNDAGKVLKHQIKATLEKADETCR